MISRTAMGVLLATWFLLCAVDTAEGQVILETALEEVAVEEDRYGDYEPVDLSQDGPVLLSQLEDWVQPPGQTVSPQPATTAPQPSLPGPGPTLVTPPPMTGPVIIEYGVPLPASPLPRRNCPPWRPCGPEESFGGNWFVKQGFAGADFRGACDFHDRCLLSGCYDRKTCDRMFLAYLDNACNCSAFPILCRIKAREMYLGVRLFGWLY